MVTINTRGLQEKNKYKDLLISCNTWYKCKQIQKVCIQEHNLHPTRDSILKSLANDMNWTAYISYASPRNDGTHWGGTAILIHNTISDGSSIVLKTTSPADAGSIPLPGSDQYHQNGGDPNYMEQLHGSLTIIHYFIITKSQYRHQYSLNLCTTRI